MTLDLGQAGSAAEIGSAAGQALYRICQEALANAIRHTPGAPVSIRLVRDARELVLSVTNPCPPEESGRQRNRPATGHGLRNMRVRASELGGSLTAGARRGDDNGADSTIWTVEARLPQ